MSDFEREILGRVPQAEAAAFFIGIRKYGWAKQELAKTASAEKYSRAQQVFRELLEGKMPEGKAGHFKTAGVLSAEQIQEALRARNESQAEERRAGQSTMGTAAGSVGAVEKEASDKTDAELKEEGRKRAVTSMAAEAHRERARRGERLGETVGRAAGALGGAAAGRKYIGGKMGTVAGLAAGYGAGGKLGKEIGTERDIQKAASAMRARLQKLAQGEMDPAGAVTGSGQAPVDQGAAGPTPQGMAPPMPEPPPPPPTVPPTMPTNYLQAEIAGRQAQEANEVAFLKERLQKATEEMEGVQGQLEQTQAEVGNLQAQVAAAAPQAMAAQQEAQQANERAIQQTQMAANLRMGAQKMREAFMQLASQDPETLGPAGQQPEAQQQGMEMEQQQMPPEGGPEAAPEPGGGAPPGTPSADAQEPGGGTEAPADSEKSPSKEEVSVTHKTGSLKAELLRRAPYAAGGAAVGAAGGLATPRKIDPLRARVEKLEGQEGSFGQAVRLAKAKAQLGMAEAAQKYPAGAAAAGALTGAGAGALLAPELARAGKNVKQYFAR